MVFRRVRAALNHRGRFVFDLNMQAGFTSRWDGSFGLATHEEVLVVHSEYFPATKLGIVELTIMTPTDVGWERNDVVLRQRCYSEDEVTGALWSAGFEDLRVFDAAEDLDLGQLGRSFFVCTAP